MTKLNDITGADGPSDGPAASQRGREFRIQTNENTVKRNESASDLREVSDDHPHNSSNNNNNADADNHSEGGSSVSTGVLTFDVYEREGFDQIMRTVAGSPEQEQDVFAQSVCEYFEIFEGLTPGR